MPIPTSAAQSYTRRRLLRDDVFDQLLAAVLDGTLAPGERLREDELIHWLGVSRTPVRDALMRLSAMGLIEMEPNRYTRVAAEDPKRLDNLLVVFVSLYRLAAVLATPSLTVADIAAMRRVLRQFQQVGKDGESIEAVKLIREFARHLIARCDNPVLAGVVEQLAPEVARAFGRHLRPEDIPPITRAAQAFLKSVETRDAKAASAAFEKVITSSSASVLAAMYSQTSRPVPRPAELDRSAAEVEDSTASAAPR